MLSYEQPKITGPRPAAADYLLMIVGVGLMALLNTQWWVQINSDVQIVLFVTIIVVEVIWFWRSVMNSLYLINLWQKLSWLERGQVLGTSLFVWALAVMLITDPWTYGLMLAGVVSTAIFSQKGDKMSHK